MKTLTQIIHHRLCTIIKNIRKYFINLIFLNICIIVKNLMRRQKIVLKKDPPVRRPFYSCYTVSDYFIWYMPALYGICLLYTVWVSFIRYYTTDGFTWLPCTTKSSKAALSWVCCVILDNTNFLLMLLSNKCLEWLKRIRPSTSWPWQQLAVYSTVHFISGVYLVYR